MAAYGKTHIHLMETNHISLPSASVGGSDATAMIAKFVADTNLKNEVSGARLGRSLFVKAEDEEFIRGLECQILGLSLNDNTFITDMLLPLQFTYDTKIKWEQIQYVPTTMTRVPALGVPYGSERVSTKFEASAKRFGQSFEIEGDAWFTKNGQQDFQHWLMYWAVTLSDTIALTAWAELMKPTSHRRHNNFQQVLNEHSYRRAVLKNRTDMFAPYKDPKGIYRLVQQMCANIKNASGAIANIVVIPQDKTALLTNGTAMSTHATGGERGLSMLMSKGVIGELVPGLAVCYPPKFCVNPALDLIQPLEQTITIGSYHTPTFAVHTDATNPENRGFARFECFDIMFDENKDRIIPLPNLPECLRRDIRFKDVGNDQFTLREYPNGPCRDPNDPFEALYALALDHPFRTKTLYEWAEWCVDNKCRYVLVAPFQRYRTQGILIAAGDKRAGVTTVSKPNLTRGEDAITQKLQFAGTCWIGAYVFIPENFMVVHNVFYNGILGGGGVSLIDHAEAEKLKSHTEWVNNAVDRPSMYFMTIGPKGEFSSDFIDLRGPHKYGNESIMTYPCAAVYGELYGWNRIDDGGNDTVSQPIAPLCFPREYNRWNGVEYTYVPGETHHGRTVGVGSKEIRLYGTNVVTDITTKGARM